MIGSIDKPGKLPVGYKRTLYLFIITGEKMIRRQLAIIGEPEEKCFDPSTLIEILSTFDQRS